MGNACIHSKPPVILPPRKGESKLFNKHKRIVIIMMENRSFDNIYGYLYGSKQAEKGVEGVVDKNLSNPVPKDLLDNPDAPDRISVIKNDSNSWSPEIDPGEPYPNVNIQLWNELDEANIGKEDLNMVAPYNLPVPMKKPNMEGYITSYVNNFKSSMTGKEGLIKNLEEKHYSQIMECFSEEMLPVMTTLAKEFCVFDHWFASVPSQTFCNRSFFVSAQSNGRVTNEPFTKWLKNDAKTLMTQLSEAGISWGVYYDATQVLPVTMLINWPDMKKHWRNFHTMTKYYLQAKLGTLPQFVFIEPRLIYCNNSMHPTIHPGPLYLPSTCDSAELLIHRVYDAIRSNAELRKDTLFGMLFDEAGGLFDHVPPPHASECPNVVPPNGAAENAAGNQMGFGFDRLGMRIPAIFVSSYLKKNTVCNTTLEHTSMMNFIRDNFGLDHQYLTERDKHANHIPDDIFDFDNPRDDWPVTKPRKGTLEIAWETLKKHLTFRIGDFSHAVCYSWKEVVLEKLRHDGKKPSKRLRSYFARMDKKESFSGIDALLFLREVKKAIKFKKKFTEELHEVVFQKMSNLELRYVQDVDSAQNGDSRAVVSQNPDSETVVDEKSVNQSMGDGLGMNASDSQSETKEQKDAPKVPIDEQSAEEVQLQEVTLELALDETNNGTE